MKDFISFEAGWGVFMNFRILYEDKNSFFVLSVDVSNFDGPQLLLKLHWMLPFRLPHFKYLSRNIGIIDVFRSWIIHKKFDFFKALINNLHYLKTRHSSFIVSSRFTCILKCNIFYPLQIMLFKNWHINSWKLCSSTTISWRNYSCQDE